MAALFFEEKNQKTFYSASMRLFVPFPLWFIRMVVRRNPWLLADHGEVSRSREIDLGICIVTVDGSVALLPTHRARLQAEADAGTLFK